MNGAGKAEVPVENSLTEVEKQITRDMIAERAYQIWLNRTETHQEASPDQDWFRAIEELESELHVA